MKKNNGIATISVYEDLCWICGESFTKDNKISIHHVLPKFLRPTKNITVPLHEKCHDRLNSNDVTTLTAFAGSIKEDLNRLIRKINALNNNICKMVYQQIKDEEKGAKEK